MELTKSDTKMMQGLSVLAMVCLHLFDRNYIGLYTPLLFFKGIPLSFYFAQLSDFCVMGFAFCSGYAHMKLYGTQNYYKKRMKGLLTLYTRVWLILIVFSIISLVVGKGAEMPKDPMTFFMNVTTLWTSYNGAWWYIFIYAILVGASPIILKIMKSYRTSIVICVSFVIYCVSYYFRFEHPIDNWFISRAVLFGMTLWEYLIGAACFKHHWFQKIRDFCEKQNSGLVYTIYVVLFFGMLIGHTLVVANVIVAPITGVVILYLFWVCEKPKIVSQFFLQIGKHSTNIWLIHMFFYLTLFKNLVYMVKFPPLIYIFMICITVVISILLNIMHRPIQMAINKIT